MQRNVENFIGCESSYQDAKIVLFGAPFDSTSCHAARKLWLGEIQPLSG